MKCATNNNVTVDPEHLKHVIQEVGKNETRKASDANYRIPGIVKTRSFKLQRLILLFNRFVNSLTIWGIEYSIENFAGNTYLNFFILSLTFFPSIILYHFCLKRFGHRFTYSFLMVLVAIVLQIAGDFQVSVVILVIAARFFNCSTLNAVYVYSAEFDPAMLRITGSWSLINGFAGIVAPFVALLADIPSLKKTFPLLIYAELAAASGVMSICLPSQVPQSGEQTEAWEQTETLEQMETWEQTEAWEQTETWEQTEAWEKDDALSWCKKPRIQAPCDREELEIRGEDTRV